MREINKSGCIVTSQMVNAINKSTKGEYGAKKCREALTEMGGDTEKAKWYLSRKI